MFLFLKSREEDQIECNTRWSSGLTMTIYSPTANGLKTWNDFEACMEDCQAQTDATILTPNETRKRKIFKTNRLVSSTFVRQQLEMLFKW